MSKKLYEETSIENIADAIRAKGGSGTFTVSQMAQAIEDLPSGGGGEEVEEKDVNFYDYDGTVVASYTAAEFAALSTMPANPTHTGLTAQGWNWELTPAKQYVADYGKLDIGQMYITDDGTSRIYIHLEENQLHTYFGLGLNGSVEVDWGDGSPTDTLSGGSFQLSVPSYVDHQYDAPGDYVITVTTNGVDYAFAGENSIFSMSILRRSSTAANTDKMFDPAVKKIEMGERAYIQQKAFYNCYLMSTITIPNHITEIPVDAFYGCNALKEVVIPSGVATIKGEAFAYCNALKHTLIPQHTTELISSAYTQCQTLKRAIIPDGVTTIPATLFNGCYALEEVVIPDSVTSIGGANPFANCRALKRVTLPTGITQITNSAFSGSYALIEVEIPDSVTSIIANAFQNCYGLTSIHIPEGVAGINQSVFSSCCSLEYVEIPSSVISIKASAFYNCTSMKEYHMKPTTPPKLAATSAFTGIPNDCVIYVPAGSLSAYQTETNWSTYASHMQEE